MPRARRPFLAVSFLAALAALVLLRSSAASISVHAPFNLDAPQTGPFPSDRYTVPDSTQNTGRRVNLPKPDCAAQPSDCADIDVLNTLDGFNLQPRLSIPFDGMIDPFSVSSDTVFLLSWTTRCPAASPRAGG